MGFRPGSPSSGSSPKSRFSKTLEEASSSLANANSFRRPASLKNQKTVNNLMSFKATGSFDLMNQTEKEKERELFRLQTGARAGLENPAQPSQHPTSCLLLTNKMLPC